MESIVKTELLSKSYFLGKTKVLALEDINLEIKRGDFIAVAGPSGSGKTTLLNLIGCLDKPSKGKIEISGQDVSQMSSDQMADVRNEKIGFIFQTFNLISVLTAYENIEFPLLFNKKHSLIQKDKIMEILDEVGLKSFAIHRPEELSGGQRQRVAIARALVKDPDIILADEPTANLDSATGGNIIELMLKLNRERGTTFIFSTHDKMIMNHANTVVNLRDGKKINSLRNMEKERDNLLN